MRLIDIMRLIRLLGDNFIRVVIQPERGLKTLLTMSILGKLGDEYASINNGSKTYK